MLIDTLQIIFNRDLLKLRTEIESYRDEKKIWYIEKNISNSGGNLCLHLVGNLNTYIGATLGNSGYVRNRELEFSLKNIPRAELLEKIDGTIAVVRTSLDSIREKDLQAEYPLLIWEEKTSIEYLLTHLATHLTYHFGQVNYHRRLLDADRNS